MHCHLIREVRLFIVQFEVRLECNFINIFPFDPSGLFEHVGATLYQHLF
jgi:hypothetical protein